MGIGYEARRTETFWNAMVTYTGQERRQLPNMCNEYKLFLLCLMSLMASLIRCVGGLSKISIKVCVLSADVIG